jgi:phage terminase large subunit-like protein
MPPPVARDHVALGREYAEDVVAGRVVACKWVVAACRRHLDDLKRQGDTGFPYLFDEEKGGRICRFVERLKHTKGPLSSRTIVLERWQCWILTSVFGWVRPSGKRRFRRVYLEMPRGQGKSALSSAIGLYMLAADGEGGAEVYSLATTRDQARIVFRDAQQMARKAPDLAQALGIEVAAHNINVKRSASKFEALASEAHTLDGLAIHAAIVDELHAHRQRDTLDVIETGTGKREQSLLWCITTAGTDRSGICYEVRTYLTKVLDRLIDDDSQFGVIYTIDDGDDWQTLAAWQKANPNWGVSVQPDVIGQLAAKAMQMPAAQNNFRTKHLCVWENADQAWMDMGAWDRCADPSLDLADFNGEKCIIGLDLATKTDIAAKAMLFRQEVSGVDHYYAFVQSYLPETAASDGRNSQYAGWEIEGRLTVTPGDVLDFQQIEDDLIEDSSRFQVEEIAYDPWQATQLAQNLQKQGANVIEFRNTVANFSAPMKELDALVRAGRFHHNADPVLSWMVSNVVCHTDAKENIYPRKERAENKIDGVVALIMALGRALVRTTDEPEYQLMFLS